MPTTPSARSDRAGSPSLAIPLAIVAVAALAAIAFFVAIGGGEEETATEAESGTIADQPTGAGTNADGLIDAPATSSDGLGGGDPEAEGADPEVAPNEAAIAEGTADAPSDTSGPDSAPNAEAAPAPEAADGEGTANETMQEAVEPSQGAADNEIVTDPDGGGAPVEPTPSGPEGRDDEALTPE